MVQYEVRVPGPTPLPPEVQEALSRPMISHRSWIFRDLLQRLDRSIRPLLGTRQEVLFLTTSGTGGLEAAVCNSIQAGDRVLSLCTGHFGDRFAAIAEKYGAVVEYLRSDPGTSVDLTALADRLSGSAYRAVLATHCETSAGVLNPVAEIARVVDGAKERPLLLVDGVSSLGAVPFTMDEIGADVVVTASQKAWMTPPGLAMVALSDRAWERCRACSTPRFYLDLAAAKASARRGETPWTPCIPLLYGLESALSLIDAEGFDSVVERHRRLAGLVRQGLESLGFRVLAAPGFESPTVTAAYLPSGVDFEPLSSVLEEDHQLQIAGGQGTLKGKVIRVGHMGYIGDANVTYLLSAVAAALERVRKWER